MAVEQEAKIKLTAETKQAEAAIGKIKKETKSQVSESVKAHRATMKGLTEQGRALSVLNKQRQNARKEWRAEATAADTLRKKQREELRVLKDKTRLLKEQAQLAKMQDQLAGKKPPAGAPPTAGRSRWFSREGMAGLGVGMAAGIGGFIVSSLLEGVRVRQGAQRAGRGMVGPAGARATTGFGQEAALGIAPEEAAGMRTAAMRARLSTSRGAALAPARLGLGFGAEFGTTLQTMGTIARTREAKGDEKKQESILRSAITEGFVAGVDKAGVDEYLSNVNKLIEVQRQVSLGQGQALNATRFMGLLMKRGELSPDLAASMSQKFSNMFLKGMKDPMFLRVAAGYGEPGRGFLESQRVIQKQAAFDPEAIQEFLGRIGKTMTSPDEMRLFFQQQSDMLPNEIDKLVDAIQKGDLVKGMEALKEGTMTEKEITKKTMEAANHIPALVAEAQKQTILMGASGEIAAGIDDLKVTLAKAISDLVQLVREAVAFWRELIASARGTTWGKAIFGSGPDKVESAAARGWSGGARARTLGTELQKGLPSLVMSGEERAATASLRQKQIGQARELKEQLMKDAQQLEMRVAGNYSPEMKPLRDELANLQQSIATLTAGLDAARTYEKDVNLIVKNESQHTINVEQQKKVARAAQGARNH